MLNIRNDHPIPTKNIVNLSNLNKKYIKSTIQIL